MQHNGISLKNTYLPLAVLIVLLIFFSNPVVAVSLSDYKYDDIEIYPLPDVNVTPIYDGTELVEIKGWDNLIFWKEWLFSEIRTMSEGTQLQHVIWTMIIPITSTVLGLCFFIIFSRRNSPEQDPASTTAKILQYLKEHPGSRQQQIVTGIQKSRGAVAYQLYRLMNENKVETIDVPNGTGYYLKQDDLSPPEILVRAALENPQTREILALLSRHPHLTRHQIAEALKKSPDTIYWHLVNIDSKILTVHKKRNGHQYSLSPDAGRIYTELTHHRIP